MLHNWIQSLTFVQTICNLCILPKVKCLTLWNVHWIMPFWLVPTHQLTKTIQNPQQDWQAPFRKGDQRHGWARLGCWMLIDYLKGGPYVKAYFIGFSFTTTGIGAHLEAVTPGKKKTNNPNTLSCRKTWTHPKMPWKKLYEGWAWDWFEAMECRN